MKILTIVPTIRVVSFLAFFFLFLLSGYMGFGNVSAEESSAESQAPLAATDEEVQPGSISGVVVCDCEGIVEGVVVIRSGLDIPRNENVEYQRIEIDSNAEFMSAEIEPGIYRLLFFEHDVLMTQDPILVEVCPGETSYVVIELTILILGMPCDQMIELGIDGFWSLIDEYPHIFGMAQEDDVNITYGRCREERNDELVHTLSQDMAVQIQAVRDALKQFDFAYWNVWFPGGTGSSHRPIRGYPYREDFFAELIGSILEGEEHEVSDKEIIHAGEVLDDLDSILERVRYVYGDDDRIWTDLPWSRLPEELTTAIEVLQDSINHLPDWVQLAVADFIYETYPEWGPYIMDQENDIEDSEKG